MIFGSDQGMAGQLNERVVDFASKSLDRRGSGPGEEVILAVGERPRGLLADAGREAAAFFAVPGSARGITPLVQDLLVNPGKFDEQTGFDRTLALLQPAYFRGASYESHGLLLLPLDQRWLDRLGQKKWPSRCRPTFTMNQEKLFSALIRQYLFVSLFQAMAESLASENASRLAAMQNAERNIEQRLNELTGQYHQRRQMSITEELLDIVFRVRGPERIIWGNRVSLIEPPQRIRHFAEKWDFSRKTGIIFIN